MALSAGDVWAYRPPLSLWRLVEQNVSPEQQDEIRSMLGTSLIEMTLDLHNEIDMLLEIWRDYQEETELEMSKTHTLAEPPHLRERLVQEICFLAEGVREKSQRKGMKPMALFSGHNSQILEYAEEVNRTGSSLSRSRPMSTCSIDGRQTPLSPSQLAFSRAELSEVIHDDVTSTADRLNYLQFDQVCTRLRDTLNKELEQLEADVQFLQECLDQATDIRSQTASPALCREPTLTELREERSLLEKELLSAESLPSTPGVSRPSFVAKSSVPKGKLQTLDPVRPRLRPAAAPGREGLPSRGSPLRAAHGLYPSSSPDQLSMSPDERTASPEGAGGGSSHHMDGVTAQTYDLHLDDNSSNAHRSPSHPGGSSSPAEDSIRRREGSGASRRRTLSPARVKVVPVGSIVGGGSRPFIPTPPSSQKPHLPRPSSAERFRKMVMHSRETT